NGKSEPLSKVHGKPELFKYLDDNITEELASSNLPGLERAKTIIGRIQNKDLYKELIRFTIDMKEEVKKFNHQHGRPVVAQTSRFIKSTKQWFCSFNVTFYRPAADGEEGIDVVSLEEARDVNHAVTGESTEEIEEYIIYCTETDIEVQCNAKQYFTNLLIGTTKQS
uniref:Uncharacterized protein n=1 Tax=Anopheles christyi TaxID=43041 RepID=A0A182K635_9DIPT